MSPWGLVNCKALGFEGAITDEPYDSNWSRTGPWGASGAIPAPTRQATPVDAFLLFLSQMPGAPEFFR
jgi:hypothetical protein